MMNPTKKNTDWINAVEVSCFRLGMIYSSEAFRVLILKIAFFEGKNQIKYFVNNISHGYDEFMDSPGFWQYLHHPVITKKKVLYHPSTKYQK